MLRSLDDLKNYAIGATDGIIGHVKDFYFDDQAWVVRYLVIDTSSWLIGRQVLISPISVGEPNWPEKLLPVSITKKQVKSSPDIDTEKPVSRQHEMAYLGYYGYPYYWGGTGLWGEGIYPGSTLLTGLDYGGSDAEYHRAQGENARTADGAQRHDPDDPHLRSCNAVITYRVHATDGEMGYVRGLLVDEETWAIRYLIVETSNWWIGHMVLIAPQWIEDVSWAEAMVSITMTRQSVKDSPPYKAGTQPDREQEVGMYRHYGRTGYWESRV